MFYAILIIAVLGFLMVLKIAKGIIKLILIIVLVLIFAGTFAGRDHIDSAPISTGTKI